MAKKPGLAHAIILSKGKTTWAGEHSNKQMRATWLLLPH
jgi:hypothetical protein